MRKLYGVIVSLALAVSFIGAVTAVQAERGGGGGGRKPTPTPIATPTPVADLEIVGITENFDPFVADLHPGEDLVYTITVRNNGPDPVAAVSVGGSLSGFGGLDVASPQGECTISRHFEPWRKQYGFSCAHGSLGVDASDNETQFDIAVGVPCRWAEQVSISALVSDDVTDDENDSASQDTDVLGLATC